MQLEVTICDKNALEVVPSLIIQTNGNNFILRGFTISVLKLMLQ